MPAPDRKQRLTAFVVAMAVLIATPLAVMASDQFSDVPDSNVFHDDIGWLADAGITKGCNPPDNTEFCPKDEVTREQMSAFMRRFAQYIGAEDGTPALADDSQRLAGDSPDAYRTVVSYAGCGISGALDNTNCTTDPAGTLPDLTTVELLATSIEAPTDGVVQVDVHALANATLWVTVDEECATYPTEPPFDTIVSQIFNGLMTASFGSAATMAGSTAGTMPAGNHVVRLCAADETEDGSGVALIANLTSQWTPGGSVSLNAANTAAGDLDISSLRDLLRTN